MLDTKQRVFEVCFFYTKSNACRPLSRKMLKDFWNRRDYHVPPICTLKCSFTNRNRAAFQKTVQTLNDCVKILSDNKAWLTELHLLSRLIYKLFCQLGKEKSLKGLKRIEACVKRYCSMDFLDYLQTTKKCIEECDQTNDEGYLPSRQMMEYIVVRLMGAAALLAKTVGYCVYTFQLVQQHLQLGMFIPQNVIFASLVSRIWALSKAGCNDFMKWYGSLRLSLDHFQSTQITFLGPEDELPVDLEEWLKQFTHNSQKERGDETIALVLPHCDVVMSDHSSADLEVSVEDNLSTLELDGIDTGVPVTRETETSLDATSNALEHTSEDSLDIGLPISRGTQNDFSFDTNKDQIDDTCILKTKGFKKMRIKIKKCSSIKDIMALIESVDIDNTSKALRKKCITKLKKLISKSSASQGQSKQQQFLNIGRKKALKTLKMIQMSQLPEMETNCGETESKKGKSDTDNKESVQYENSYNDVYPTNCAALRAMKNNLKTNGSIMLGSDNIVVTDPHMKKKIVVKLNKCINDVKTDPSSKAETIGRAMKTITKLTKKFTINSPTEMKDCHDKMRKQDKKLRTNIKCFSNDKPLKKSEKGKQNRKNKQNKTVKSKKSVKKVK